MTSELESSFVANGLPAEYILNNFNDFGMGMITCWDLLIVNNWNYITQSYMIATDNDKSVTIFFIIFNIIVTLLVLNVTIAFLIDYLVGRWESFNKESTNLEMETISIKFDKKNTFED